MHTDIHSHAHTHNLKRVKTIKQLIYQFKSEKNNNIK